MASVNNNIYMAAMFRKALPPPPDFDSHTKSEQKADMSGGLYDPGAKQLPQAPLPMPPHNEQRTRTMTISRRPVGADHAVRSKSHARGVSVASASSVYSDAPSLPSMNHSEDTISRNSIESTDGEQEMRANIESKSPLQPTFESRQHSSSTSSTQSSPPGFEIWRRRSSKNDKDLSIRQLTLSSSNGYTEQYPIIEHPTPPANRPSLKSPSRLPQSQLSTGRRPVPNRPAPPQPETIEKTISKMRRSKKLEELESKAGERSAESPSLQANKSLKHFTVSDYLFEERSSNDLSTTANTTTAVVSPTAIANVSELVDSNLRRQKQQQQPRHQYHLQESEGREERGRKMERSLDQEEDESSTTSPTSTTITIPPPTSGLRPLRLSSQSPVSSTSSQPRSHSSPRTPNRGRFPVVARPSIPESPSSLPAPASLESIEVPLPVEQIETQVNSRQIIFPMPHVALASGSISPAPKILFQQIKCYQEHANWRESKNDAKHCPVACAMCETADTGRRWMCTWCSLRCCEDCHRSLLQTPGKSLTQCLKTMGAAHRIPPNIPLKEEPEKPAVATQNVAALLASLRADANKAEDPNSPTQISLDM